MIDSGTLLLIACGVLCLVTHVALAAARAAVDRAVAGSTGEDATALAATASRLALTELFSLGVGTTLLATATWVAWPPLIAGSIMLLVVIGTLLSVSAARSWALDDAERSAPLARTAIGVMTRMRLVAWLDRVGQRLALRAAPPRRAGPVTLSTPDREGTTDPGPGTADLRASVDDFVDTIAREVMVPRTDMVLVESDFGIDDALQVALAHGYSRLPVLGADRDDIVGIVYAKDLMKRSVDGEGGKSVDLVLHAAWFIPETKRLAGLLREMQASKTHLAMVVDEYGGTAGLVTLEDVLEELVGDIVDEFDDEDDDVIVDGERRYRINARATVNQVNELLELDLPEGDWTTVGGLAFHRFGRVPMIGEQVPIAGCRITILSVAKRRIGVVLLEAPAPDVVSIDPLEDADESDSETSDLGEPTVSSSSSSFLERSDPMSSRWSA